MPGKTSLSLMDKPSMERWKEAIELGKRGKAAVGRLVPALKEEDKWVRCLVADALGNIPDSCVVTPLISALQDPDQDVRFTAAKALGRVGDARAREALERILAIDNSYVRIAAEEAIALLRHGASSPGYVPGREGKKAIE